MVLIFFILLDNSLIRGFNRCDDDGGGGGWKVRLVCRHMRVFYEPARLLQVVRRAWSDGKSTRLRVKG